MLPKMNHRSPAPAGSTTHVGPELGATLRTVLAETSGESLIRLASAALEAHAVEMRLSVEVGEVRRTGLPEAWTRDRQEALAALGNRVAQSSDPLIHEDLRVQGLSTETAAVKEAGVLACAGVPLVLPDGTTVGSLCAVDVRPHAWTDRELEVIREVAACATRELWLRLSLAEYRQSGRYFRALVENAAEIITVLDEEGVILYESPSLTHVLGYEPEELVGRSAFDFVHPEDLPHVLQAFSEVLETPGHKLAIEYRFRDREGEWRRFSSTGTNGLQDPAIAGVAVSSRDVTARQEAQEQLRVQKAYFERLFESAPEAVVLLDTDDRVIHANPEFTRIFGYSAEEAVGRAINTLIAPDSERESSRAITERVAAGEAVQVEGTRIRKDGSAVEVSILGAPVEMDHNRIGVFGIYRDITERKATEARLAAYAEELRHLSLTDELTGLANRRGFFTLAEHQVGLAQRSGTRLVLLFLDVDDMKKINDALGHAAGDRALADAAGILRATFRGADVVARIGGDEFAVLAWVEGVVATDALLDRLQQSLDDHNARQDRPYALSMSAGAAEYDPASPTPLHNLLRQADAAMYEVKRSR